MAYGTGRIRDIIAHLESTCCAKIVDIGTEDKLNALCEAMQVSSDVIDSLIALNSPVLRTVKGHAFETVFDALVRNAGFEITEVGGDNSTDRVVNNATLQLKTPTVSGGRPGRVQFKTHKTHGAKSERESMEYYSHVSQFSDFLVGLIGYDPFNVLVLNRDELPRHTLSSDRIQSPFYVDWQAHPALNAFHRLGIEMKVDASVFARSGNELLPRTAAALNLGSSIIVDTILSEANFRVWDMSMRGFLRESVFRSRAQQEGIELGNAVGTRAERSDKADFVVKTRSGTKYLQMKGLTVSYCNFEARNRRLGIETQLTRGRVNDHPTQSRLYHQDDFDTLVVALDPPLAELFTPGGGLHWEFYAIPTGALSRHPRFSNRLKSVQVFSYEAVQQYRVKSLLTLLE